MMYELTRVLVKLPPKILARVLVLLTDHVAMDAKFEEAKHPRDKAGRFGSGGSGGSSKRSTRTVQDRADILINDSPDLPKIKPPKVLYHVTTKENAAKILKEGLIPGKTRNTSTGKSRGVYLGDSPEEMLSGRGSGFDVVGKDLVVLKIPTAGLKLRADPEFYYGRNTKKDAKDWIESVNEGQDAVAFYSEHKIPPTSISVTRIRK